MARNGKTVDPSAQRDALILEIVPHGFFTETLETRNRDQPDFHEVAVWVMRDALEEAFEANWEALHWSPPMRG